MKRGNSLTYLGLFHLVLELSLEESVCLSRGVIFWAFTKVLDLLSPTSILVPKDDLNGTGPGLLLILYYLHLVGSSIVRRSSVNNKVTAACILDHLLPMISKNQL